MNRSSARAAPGILALIGLIAVLVAPLLLFYFIASMAWRSQEMSLIAQSMAQMAVRFSEPEHVANGAIVTVGQADPAAKSRHG